MFSSIRSKFLILPKYPITIEYAHNNFAFSFKPWWFAEIIDKNPNILKGKKIRTRREIRALVIVLKRSNLVNTGSLEPMIFSRNASNAHVDKNRNANRLTASDGMACAPVDADPEEGFPVPVFGEPPPLPLVIVWLLTATDSLNEFSRSLGLI